MALLDLPNELLLAVAGFLECDVDINALVRTNRRLYTLLNAFLYRHNVHEAESAGLVVAQFPKHRVLHDPSAMSQQDLHEYHNPSQPTTPDGLPIPLTPDVLALDRTIGLFLENGATLEYRHKYSKCTDLHFAASGRNEALFFLLIRHGADVNTRGRDSRGHDSGKTTLHAAASGGCIRILRFLLMEKKMVVNALDSEGYTPLHRAVTRFNEAAVRLLVDHGADINGPAGAGNGLPVLHTLVTCGKRGLGGMCLAIVRVLLELGADIQWRTEPEGWTPLHVAACVGADGELVEGLLELGALLEARSATGMTPLHMAVREGSLDVAETLLKHGADINSRRDNGRLLLYTAVARPDADVIVPWLVERGADVHVMVGDGIEKTVLQYLEDQGLMGLLEGQRRG